MRESELPIIYIADSVIPIVMKLTAVLIIQIVEAYVHQHSFIYPNNQLNPGNLFIFDAPCVVVTSAMFSNSGIEAVTPTSACDSL